MLQIGDKIPVDIKVLNQDAKEVTLSDYLNNDFLVIYFYPKDDTSGCTTEACSFRDFNSEIEKAGASIVGISKDPVKSHVKFIEKNELNFDLLSDEDLKLNEAFGVWVEKSMYGRKYMGTQRATFLVNKKGEVVYVWEKVKPKEHGSEVLDVIKGFNA